MSFGFGVGDFIAIGELCWKIYSRVYKVARDAPEELRALIQELGNLSNTVNLLNEEVRDREEWLKRAGERRLEYTCKVMGQTKETLQKMDRLADKYAELGTGDSSGGPTRSFRIQWNRVKYAFEVSSINELRAKFMSHNLHLSLLLQGAQNSSLERIEKQQTRTDTKLEELRSVMIGDRSSRENPLLKSPLDEEVRMELSAAFLRSAETGNRPWASIGIDDWLRAGKWWLLKARSQIDRLPQSHVDNTEAYINLLKACWILTDVVSIHPQRTHLGASDDKRNDDIRNLSQIAKTSLQSFPVFDIQFHDAEDYAKNIWPQAPPSSTVVPLRQFSMNSDKPRWQTSDGEVLFQCFAKIRSTKSGIETVPEECFLMLEVPRQGISLNLILQSFSGQDIHKLRLEPDDDAIHYSDFGYQIWLVLQQRMKDMGSFVHLLKSNTLMAIIWAFQVFETEFRPASLTASMVHSVSVIANWPAGYWKYLMLPGYDTGGPDRCDSVALLLRTVINGLDERLDQDKRQNSELLANDIRDKYSALGVFVWKVLCWQCEKFEDIKLLLEEFNAEKHLQRDFLVQTSFLKLDRGFLSQMEQYLNYEDGWHPDNASLMLEAALSSEDAEYISLLLKRLASRVLLESQVAIFNIVNRSGTLGQINAMTQIIFTRPASIAAIMASFLTNRDEQGFRDFLHTVKSYGGSFSSKTADEVDFSNFRPSFVAACAELIEKQSSNTLNLYLDALEGLGIDFRTTQGCGNTESSQLALLPALVAPHPEFLRILLQRKVVVADMQPFIVERRQFKIWHLAPKFVDLIEHPPSWMPHWPLYSAVMLVCDTEFLQLLCEHGATLQQESTGTEGRESKAQGIVDHLSRLSNLEDARLEHTDALLFFHVLIQIGVCGVHHPDSPCNRLCATNTTTDYQETWRCMARLLYRFNCFDRCFDPCFEYRKGGWKDNSKTRSKLMSRYTKFPEQYPEHLLTQSSWDRWRRDALQILSMVE